MYQKRLNEILERKAQIETEIQEADATRMTELETEVDTLNAEEKEIRSKMDLTGKLGARVELPNDATEERAKAFAESGRMSIQARQLLAAGVLTPTLVKDTIGELPQVVSSIVDDVNAFDATGAGAWGFAYRKTDAEAAEVTDGSAVAGTAGTFDKGTINPTEWGILDEISNQVKKLTPINYAQSIQNNAYLALRRYAKKVIVDAVLASDLAEKVTVAIDQTYIRKLVLGYDSDESVAGNAKLYLCKADLQAIGAVRGTNEKKAVFEIEFSDENNGTIKDGGLAVAFSICSNLTAGKQLYGNPKTIDMPLWGDYEVTTDEGGDYFKRNMMGIRGLQTGGAALTHYHGMQIVSNSSSGS